jgi:hypothetical protein
MNRTLIAFAVLPLLVGSGFLLTAAVVLSQSHKVGSPPVRVCCDLSEPTSHRCVPFEANKRIECDVGTVYLESGEDSKMVVAEVFHDSPFVRYWYCDGDAPSR